MSFFCKYNLQLLFKYPFPWTVSISYSQVGISYHLIPLKRFSRIPLISSLLVLIPRSSLPNLIQNQSLTSAIMPCLILEQRCRLLLLCRALRAADPGGVRTSLPGRPWGIRSGAGSGVQPSIPWRKENSKSGSVHELVRSSQPICGQWSRQSTLTIWS